MLAGSQAATAAGLYRCTMGSTSYMSDRPCNGGTELRALGNTQHTLPYNPSYVAPMAKAPDHLQYLSAECAQLNDAIRTGPARGLTNGPMNELRIDYQKRCSEDESQARQQLQSAQKQARDRRHDQQAAQQSERTRAALSADQCYEMLRVLAGKRQRVSTMSDGERGDLQLFEDNYKSRCPHG